MKNWRNYLASVTVIAVLMTCEVACAQAEQEAGATSRPFEKRILQRFDKDGDGKLSPQRARRRQKRMGTAPQERKETPVSAGAGWRLSNSRLGNTPA